MGLIRIVATHRCGTGCACRGWNLIGNRWPSHCVSVFCWLSILHSMLRLAGLRLLAIKGCVVHSLQFRTDHAIDNPNMPFLFPYCALTALKVYSGMLAGAHDDCMSHAVHGSGITCTEGMLLLPRREMGKAHPVATACKSSICVSLKSLPNHVLVF